MTQKKEIKLVKMEEDITQSPIRQLEIHLLPLFEQKIFIQCCRKTALLVQYQNPGIDQGIINANTLLFCKLIYSISQDNEFRKSLLLIHKGIKANTFTLNQLINFNYTPNTEHLESIIQSLQNIHNYNDAVSMVKSCLDVSHLNENTIAIFPKQQN